MEGEGHLETYGSPLYFAAGGYGPGPLVVLYTWPTTPACQVRRILSSVNIPAICRGKVGSGGGVIPLKVTEIQATLS